MIQFWTRIELFLYILNVPTKCTSQSLIHSEVHSWVIRIHKTLNRSIKIWFCQNLVLLARLWRVQLQDFYDFSKYSSNMFKYIYAVYAWSSFIDFATVATVTWVLILRYNERLKWEKDIVLVWLEYRKGI